MRQVVRLAALALAFAVTGIDYVLRRGWAFTPQQRASWLQRTASLMLKAMGFEVSVSGGVPTGSFIAPNHLGYMDIVVLASVAPQVFLSKADVAEWAVIGRYTKMAGTLYIDRGRRGDVAGRDGEFARVIEAGLCMTVFLEGTSSDGSRVLPFRSSLLAPVVANRWPVTPARIRYQCEGGDPATDVCWWGDMGFGSHMLRMAGVRRVRASVVFGDTREPGADRKVLAAELQAEVERLGEATAAGVPRLLDV